MIFEIGKFYKHNTGVFLSIVGEAETTMWGKTLVGESNEDAYNLIPIGSDKASAVNWVEIPKEEWMTQFERQETPSKPSQEGPQETSTGDRRFCDSPTEHSVDT